MRGQAAPPHPRIYRVPPGDSSPFIYNRQFSTAVAIAPFEIYGWKLTGYLVFVCSFSCMLTKFSKGELFSCLLKFDRVTNYCKRPISLIFRRIKRSNVKLDGKANGRPLFSLRASPPFGGYRKNYSCLLDMRWLQPTHIQRALLEL